MIREILDIVPDDVAQQYRRETLVETLWKRFGSRRIDILDLGCGDGRSVKWFRDHGFDMSWKGLDIADSPEVRSRTRSDAEFHSYDGVNIPFGDNSFDLVFSIQVFEHIRQPEAVLREIRRVLKRNGTFAGSVSYLEPYHSYSIFNFTPYGWHKVNTDNGLRPIMMAGGVDGIGLIRRSMSRSNEEKELWSCSQNNRQIIDDVALNTKQKNYNMLMYSGHMFFMSVKDD